MENDDDDDSHLFSCSLRVIHVFIISFLSWFGVSYILYSLSLSLHVPVKNSILKLKIFMSVSVLRFGCVAYSLCSLLHSDSWRHGKERSIHNSRRILEASSTGMTSEIISVSRHFVTSGKSSHAMHILPWTYFNILSVFPCVSVVPWQNNSHPLQSSSSSSSSAPARFETKSLKLWRHKTLIHNTVYTRLLLSAVHIPITTYYYLRPSEQLGSETEKDVCVSLCRTDQSSDFQKKPYGI